MKELRMTAIILLVGVFLLSGCFFSSKHEVTFKTNGGSEVKNTSVKSGNKLDVPETPTKDGYVFEGWYLNGKEYNFEDEVNEDITLVAKWRKVEVDGEEKNEENEENNEGEKEITTTASTTKKITTKKTTASGTVKTTTKKTTTSTTTKTTTSTTTKVVEKPTEPEEPTIPEQPTPDEPNVPEEPVIPEEPTIPEKKELKMNITVTEVIVDSMLIEAKDKNVLETLVNDNNGEAIEEVNKKYNLVIDVDSDEINTLSNLGEDDLNELLSSDITKWEINDQKGNIFELEITGTKISSSVEYDVKAITIKNGDKAYVITFDEEEQKWVIDYPSVMVTSEDKVMYYANLNDALGTTISGDKVSILRDLEISEEVVLDKAITIDGGNFKINSSSGYLFIIRNVDDETRDIIIANMEVKVKGLLCVEELKVKSITIENIKGSYTNKIVDNSSLLEIIENNLNLDFLENEEDNLNDEKTL